MQRPIFTNVSKVRNEAIAMAKWHNGRIAVLALRTPHHANPISSIPVIL